MRHGFLAGATALILANVAGIMACGGGHGPTLDDASDEGDDPGAYPDPGGNPTDTGRRDTDEIGACTPDCFRRECGDDGCGGSCGSCDRGYCDNLTWHPLMPCVPGALLFGGTYQTRACQAALPRECDDRLDCTDDACDEATGCSNVVRPGWCTVDGICIAAGDPAGDQPCRGCVPDVRTTGEATFPDGTPCPGGVCFEGSCCVPSCQERICGDDGCGGSCGTCPVGNQCRSGLCVESPCPTGYMVIPAGEFEMGESPDEPGRDCIQGKNCTGRLEDHVTLTRDLCVKETEVTQKEWRVVMGTDPSYFKACGDSCPVERVSWWDAVVYCNALSVMEGLEPCYGLDQQHGQPGGGCPGRDIQGCYSDFAYEHISFVGLDCTGYRLPTAAEWEYAARAGTRHATYNGSISSVRDDCEFDATVDAIAWFCGSDAVTYPGYSGTPNNCAHTPCGTHPVGQKLPNAWGLYDMLGNVLEPVWDWLAYYPAGPLTDPTGPVTGEVRQARGGDWVSPPKWTRVTSMWGDPPNDRTNAVGIRPVRSVVAGRKPVAASRILGECPGSNPVRVRNLSTPREE